MFKKLPSFYSTSQVTKSLYDIIQKYIDDEIEISDDMKLQFFVDTATWGLALFEEMYCIDAISDDYESRRAVIKTKLLGEETTTISRLKEICLAVCNSSIDLIEDYDTCTIYITFLDIYGEPPNYDKMLQQVRNILPAHIGFETVFSFILWETLKENTWRQLSVLTWEESAVTKI